MLSDTSQPEGPATVKFPHRSRRGVLLGLSAPQLIVVTLTGLLLLAVLLTASVTGALKLIPLWAVILAAVFIRHRGRSLADWAPIAARYALRRFRGQLIWLARPSTRPRREACSISRAPRRPCAWSPPRMAVSARCTIPTTAPSPRS